MNEVSSSGNPLLAIMCVVIIIFGLACEWIVFQKAGEPGWKAIVPLYNMYTMYKFCWGNGWMFLLTFVPVANIVVTLMLAYKLAKSFGHGIGFCLLYIFFPIIALPILAFGNSRYLGPS